MQRLKNVPSAPPPSSAAALLRTADLKPDLGGYRNLAEGLRSGGRREGRGGSINRACETHSRNFRLLTRAHMQLMVLMRSRLTYVISFGILIGMFTRQSAQYS